VTDHDLAGRIQHTLYSIGAGPARVEKHCGECITYGFAAAMVPARLVPFAIDALAGTGIPVCTAVDFPHGLMSDTGRLIEATTAVELGAAELDLGVPIGLLKDGQDEAFMQSIARVVTAVAPIEVKVMLELPLLNSAEASRAVRLAIDAGAQWLKNASSGTVGPATPDQIRYLRGSAPPSVRVKASGSIHTAQRAHELLAAGADLIGTSHSVDVVTGVDGEVDGNDY
jgi:deoxyribose-phosphate aldolase